MAGSNSIPERLINFAVYDEGKSLIGIANVDLPEVSYMTDTVTGAGIAGEVDSPVLGHFGAMSLTLNWRTIEGDVLKLAKPGVHALELRGSQQKHDAARGTYETVPVRVVTRCLPKSVGLGSFEVGSTTDTTTELEVTYMKVEVGGVELCEIDKFNFIAKFGGNDVLAGVRADLGM